MLAASAPAISVYAGQEAPATAGLEASATFSGQALGYFPIVPTALMLSV